MCNCPQCGLLPETHDDYACDMRYQNEKWHPSANNAWLDNWLYPDLDSMFDPDYPDFDKE